MTGVLTLAKGKVIAKHWRITKRLGKGSFGAVYQVKHIHNREEAALKVEVIRKDGQASVLKLEAHILRRLAHCHLFANVIQTGKKSTYSYMVMSLLGASLDTLIGKSGSICTVSTQIRVGINALCALKALHDMGFIHRDIKPANMAVGVNDRARIIHIFDFGLARQYVIFGEGHKPKLRRPRKKARFRGTYRYCSINTHSRGEQGRDDDLWSLLYTLVEMRGKLPWANEYTDEVIHHFKKVTPIDDLLANCPFQLLEFAQHLETLNYYIRPDYSLLYQTMEDVRKVGHIKYSDPYDWEQEEFERLSAEKVKRKNHSVDRTQASATAITAEKDEEHNPFPIEFFTSNPLGF